MFQKMCTKKEFPRSSAKKIQKKHPTFPLFLAAILLLASSLSFPVRAAEVDEQAEVEAVSYTHLDVYKRQPHYHGHSAQMYR